MLLEKAIYYIDAGDVTYAKNGFHLHFPNLFLSKPDQQEQLIPRVQQIIGEMDIFANLGITDSATVVDKAACTNPWLLYGSRKSEEMDPYLVTKVFDSDGLEISVEEAFKYYQLYDANEKLIPLREKVMRNMPRILSIVPFGRQSFEVRSGLACPAKEKIQKDKKYESNCWSW